VAPPVSREGGQTEAMTAKPLSASPPLTANRVDRMYRQLAKIHAITTAQLAECVRWRWSDSAPGLVQARTGRQRPTTTPFTTRLAPSPPTDFSH
jgi:hypothetical protein